MTNKPTIHWLGAGLSSGPGIIALAQGNHAVTLWNRTPAKALEMRKHLKAGASLAVETLDMDRLQAALKPGDVVVSMLPAALHAEVARRALAADAHMVTTSYLSPEMAELNDDAKRRGLCVVNEVGLDPGIDHLFAHLLVDAAKRDGALGRGGAVDFVSYCGGIPAVATPFTYKFSWAPYGVLTALRNQARFVADGGTQTSDKAWESVSNLALGEETFEVYPNRDSLPYVDEYGLAGETGLRTFVRGTLRMNGWKEAWADMFAKVEVADDATLKAISDDLWDKHAYRDGEQDRVIMHVGLSIDGPDGAKWQGSMSLDEKGSGWRTAMARTVSLTAAQAIEAVLDGRMPTGVQAATQNVAEARRWLNGLHNAGITIHSENVAPITGK